MEINNFMQLQLTRTRFECIGRYQLTMLHSRNCTSKSEEIVGYNKQVMLYSVEGDVRLLAFIEI